MAEREWGDADGTVSNKSVDWSYTVTVLGISEFLWLMARKVQCRKKGY